MAWDPLLAQIREVLQELYPDVDQSRVLVDDAGVPVGRIQFKADSKTNWHNILREADLHGMVPAVLAVAQKDYPNHNKLRSAGDGYLANVPTQQTPVQPLVTRVAQEGPAVPSHSPVPEPATEPEVPESSKEVILLIHGIRTQAEWQDVVAKILEAVPGAMVYPLKYEYFDAFRFLCPILTRRAPINELLWRIRAAKQRFPEAKLSVIAHSYGTYAIGKILTDNPDIRLHRLVLCGSILPRNFRWDQIRERVETEILNDCAFKDIWPVLAQSSTIGYGASGTFGFGTPEVRDRFHNFGHSGYFEGKFVSDYWLPWFENGQRVQNATPPTAKYWWSLLTVFQIKWVLLFALFAILFWLQPGIFKWPWGERQAVSGGQSASIVVPTLTPNHYYSKRTKEAFFEWTPVGVSGGLPHWELLAKTDNDGLIEIDFGKLPMDRNSKRVDLSAQKKELPDELFLRFFVLDSSNQRLLEGGKLLLTRLD